MWNTSIITPCNATPVYHAQNPVCHVFQDQKQRTAPEKNKPHKICNRINIRLTVDSFEEFWQNPNARACAMYKEHVERANSPELQVQS